MCEEEPYNEAFSRGDQLILELIDGDSFKGEYIDGGPNRIELINVKQRNNPNDLEGIHAFYRKEIENICVSWAKVKQKPIFTKEEDDDIIKIDKEEYYRHREMAKAYVYIDKIGKAYYYAVRRLSEAETIGMFPLRLKDSQDDMIQLLAVSTWQEVFLFDFVGHKKKDYCYPDIKKILEMDVFCKVIHNSGHFVNILKRNYKIQPNNIFDTHTIDLIIQKSRNDNCPEKSRNITKCLKHYFNLPNGLTRDAVNSIDEEDWAERPLTDEKKLYASQLATYLVLLRDEMESIMMAEANNALDEIHEYLYALSGYDFCCICQKTKVPKKIRNMIPTFNPLDIEKVWNCKIHGRKVNSVSQAKTSC